MKPYRFDLERILREARAAEAKAQAQAQRHADAEHNLPWAIGGRGQGQGQERKDKPKRSEAAAMAHAIPQSVLTNAISQGAAVASSMASSAKTKNGVTVVQPPDKNSN